MDIAANGGDAVAKESAQERNARLRDEVGANIERVRSLAEAGENTAELTAETEALIGQLPARSRKKLTVELTEAGQTQAVSTGDYRAIEGMPGLVTQGASILVDGINLNLQASDVAKKVAELLLDVRRRMPTKHGVPDLGGRSQDYRDFTRDMYRAAGERLAGDEVEVALSVRRFTRSVQRHMSDHLAEYVRQLDNAPDEAQGFYGKALDAYPDETPSEAVWRFYEGIGNPLPRQGQTEIARAKGQETRALAQAAKDLVALEKTEETFEKLAKHAERYGEEEAKEVADRLDALIATLAKLRATL